MNAPQNRPNNPEQALLRSQAQGVKFRAFAGPADFEAMVACANASFAADQTGFFSNVEDVARDYAAFTSCVPERDVWIAEVGKEIAGYVRSWHWAQADGLRLYGQVAVMAPQWRRQGIGANLHAWLESRQLETAALISRSLRAQAATGMNESAPGVDSQNLSGANRVYEDCGFVVARRNCVYRKPLEVGGKG